MKKILILGGTNFIGRNLVERLLEMDAYEVTLFNRQRTHANLFPTVSKLKGDRETKDIQQIADRNWDVVIDLSCYYPDALNSTLNAIKEVKKYIFVSTCSVYDNAHTHTRLRNEQSEILGCSVAQKVDRSPETYGNRKAECERILHDSGLPYVILRPALVYGKYDPTDRLYYWMYQVNMMDTLLLPEKGKRLFSTTYVSDLVDTILQSLKQNIHSETYNVITSPETSIKQIVDVACNTLKREFSIINGSPEFLKEHNISQWTDMPLWINGDHFTYSNQKLREDLGIKTTDLEVALNKTMAYYEYLNWPEPKYGMPEARSRELIDKLKS